MRRIIVKRLSKSIARAALAALLIVSLVGCQTTAKKAAEPIPAAPAVAPAPEKPAEVPAPAPAPVKEEAPAPVKAEVPAPVETPKAAPAPVAQEPAKPTSDYPYGVNTIVRNTQGDKEFDLFVVHTNDINGNFQGEAGGLSLGQFATLANIGKQITDNYLVLNAGNMGVTEANALQVAKALDAAGYDAYTPQTIQLATGIEGTEKAAALSANALDANGYLLETPYQVYDFNGFKVAVVGLTMPKDVDGVSFTSDVIVANAQTALDIADKLVDYIIVLTDAPDTGDLSSQFLAENLKGIDLIVDSGDTVSAKIVGDTEIVHADADLMSIGVVQLHVKDGKVVATYPMSVPADAITDPADSALVQQYASIIAGAGYDPKVAVPDDQVVAGLLPYPYGVQLIEKNTKGDKTFDLIVVHTNDVHARVVPQDGGMGYAKLGTLLNAGRSITDNMLVLDAGDTTHGTNFANLFQGETVDALLEELGYDAIAPGNHDFNYGTDHLVEMANIAATNGGTLRVLSANVKKNGKLLFQPYQLYDFNGFKVGVIGLSTPDTLVTSNPKNTEGVDFSQDDFYGTVQKMVDLVKKYADFIIVDGHIGLDPTGPSGITSDQIAEKVKGIDLFVDGHSHTVLKSGDQVGDTLIVSTGEYLKNVGVVDILVKDGKAVSKTAMLIQASDVLEPEKSDLAKQFGVTSVPDDPQITATIESINKDLNVQLNKVIAVIPEDLDGERAHVRTRKTNLSKMIVDAITKDSGADFTITNGGGIRASLKSGKVTRGDVMNVLPFTNVVYVCEIKGSDVYAALEHGYSKLPETAGSYAQTDLQVVYSKYAKPGNRIKRVLLNGQLIDKDATYKVATNDFMAAGGDGYTMFGNVVSRGKMLSDVFMEYLSENYPVK